MLGEDRFFNEFSNTTWFLVFGRFPKRLLRTVRSLPARVCSIGLRSEFDLRKTQFVERTVVKRYRLSETIFRSLDVFPHFSPKYQEPGRVSKVFRRNPTPNGHARSGCVSSSLIFSKILRQQATFIFFFEHSRSYIFTVSFGCRFSL